MSVPILILESLAIAAAFGVMIFVMMEKNPAGMVADYPPEIQEAYYKSREEKSEREKLTAKNYIAKAVFMIVALALVAVLAILAGARNFWQGFFAAAIYVLVIFAFDTFVIDWIFFPRIKKWRLPGTEKMDKEYAQKWFHVKACLPMIPVFLVFAILAGGIVKVIFS